jgi:hypothetical protein
MRTNTKTRVKWSLSLFPLAMEGAGVPPHVPSVLLPAPPLYRKKKSSFLFNCYFWLHTVILLQVVGVAGYIVYYLCHQLIYGAEK